MEEQIEELQLRCENLESENIQMKKRLDNLVSKINQLIEINELIFPE